MNLNGLPVAMPASREEDTLWEATSWSVVVNYKGRSKRFSLSLSYARVGSHPGCEIVLDNPRLPPVAYLLVAFQGDVEAWPVAPIAMPRWGVLADGEEFPIGTFRVSVELQPPLTQAAEPASQRYPELGVVVGDRRWSAKLHRRVTIVGDDHPSVKRLRDVGLHTCHGAFIAGDQRLWYLPLSPQQAPCLTGHNLAVEMRQGQAVEAGRVRFLCLAAPTGSLDAVPGKMSPNEMVTNQAAPSETLTNETLPNETLTNQAVTAQAIDSLMLDRSAGKPKPSRKLAAKVQPTAVAAPRELCPDGFTSQVTDRMVRMGRRRVLKARLVLGAAVSLAVLSAVMVLMKIWNSLSAG